ncbi:hypothetical protein K7432_017407 [Basidiobolus ranarum]|uniref:Uncharacterized protein n=1 Tax=Basidiobolus ranarum TaxID=34480 RepID=A0ABR2VKI8_9FUNG
MTDPMETEPKRYLVGIEGGQHVKNSLSLNDPKIVIAEIRTKYGLDDTFRLQEFTFSISEEFLLRFYPRFI